MAFDSWPSGVYIKRSYSNPRWKDKARCDRWRSHVHCNCYSVGGICGHYITRQLLLSPELCCEGIQHEEIPIYAKRRGYNCTNWVTGKVEQESDASEFDIVNCLQDAQIMGVPQLHSYNAYLQYKARVEPLMPPLGRCSKADCSMIQWFDICTSQVSAKLLLMYSTDVHVRGSINPCTFLAALSQNLLMCWTGNLLLLICLPLHCSSQSPTIASTLPLHSLGNECAKTQYMVVLTAW